MGYSLNVLIEGLIMLRNFIDYFLIVNVSLLLLACSSFMFLSTYVEYKSYNSECVSVDNEKQD